MTRDTIEEAMEIAIGHHQSGRLAEAEGLYRQVLAQRPDHADALNLLGVLVCQAGQPEVGIDLIGRAITNNPAVAEYHSNLGAAYGTAGRGDGAIASFRRAVELRPDWAEAYTNLGSALGTKGRLDEALACFRKAVALKPDLSPAASNLLFTLHYHPDYDAQAILAEHRHWARQFAEPLAAQIRPHDNDRTPDRRLRIGFLSPDFSGHPVGLLLLPLFSHHDRRQFEFVCYSDVKAADAVTEQLKALADMA
jgi:protein O-GlcNAc transferase